jgi:hypothetical protein
VVIDGKLLSERETEPLWDGLDDILAAIGDDAGPILEDRPWNSPNAKALDLMTIPDKVMSVDAPAIAKKAILADFVSETGVPSNRQSYVTDIRSYSAAEEYQAFYPEIGESFQGRLEELSSALPEDLASRNASISENLAALNPILRKLEPKHAAHLYSELKTFAKHVARASGGFLKFWSVSAEEKKWIELPMVDTFEWNEETEQ